MRTPLHERVEAGAMLLDKAWRRLKTPWRDKIDLKKLNLASYEECLLGQVYGDYFSGLERLGIGLGWEYGFNPGDGDQRALKGAWRKYIEATR